MAIAIPNNNQGGETKTPATFNNFGYSANMDYTVSKIQIRCIYSTQ